MSTSNCDPPSDPPSLAPSDDTSLTPTSHPDTLPAPPPSPDGREERVVFEGVSFVRGGGSVFTIAHEQQMEATRQDTLRRQAEADAERAQASRPVEEGGAKLYGAPNNLGGNTDTQVAYVLLTFVDRRGDAIFHRGEPVQCLADVLWISPTERHLQIVCPSCVDKNVPQAQAQLTISNKNRGWHLDEKFAGRAFTFNDGYDTKTYRSAGMVMDSDVITCPACKWACKIDKNKVWRV